MAICGAQAYTRPGSKENTGVVERRSWAGYKKYQLNNLCNPPGALKPLGEKATAMQADYR